MEQIAKKKQEISRNKTDPFGQLLAFVPRTTYSYFAKLSYMGGRTTPCNNCRLVYESTYSNCCKYLSRIFSYILVTDPLWMSIALGFEVLQILVSVIIDVLVNLYLHFAVALLLLF